MPPASAAASLEQARSRTLAQHVAEKQWDYDTRRYFKSLNSVAAETAATDTVVSDPVVSAERQRFRKLLQEAEILPISRRS
ncbi:hypothetical protein [Desulfosarcina ovata]|uniref:Uncharacterized protein n=1 Tax=Desulfosarcina ovata subsp. ovata TaxID=2752305 RepID=A0A5K8AFG6_9BACT|nr:hypothetical protein [Desulfosarcina ovata]BBO91347.1 hypothetical protein DSCOOX_45270 [Desulfosarcina ovata subsp. ovata]